MTENYLREFEGAIKDSGVVAKDVQLYRVDRTALLNELSASVGERQRLTVEVVRPVLLDPTDAVPRRSEALVQVAELRERLDELTAPPNFIPWWEERRAGGQPDDEIERLKAAELNASVAYYRGPGATGNGQKVIVFRQPRGRAPERWLSAEDAKAYSGRHTSRYYPLSAAKTITNYSAPDGRVFVIPHERARTEYLGDTCVVVDENDRVRAMIRYRQNRATTLDLSLYPMRWNGDDGDSGGASLVNVVPGDDDSWGPLIFAHLNHNQSGTVKLNHLGGLEYPLVRLRAFESNEPSKGATMRAAILRFDDDGEAVAPFGDIVRHADHYFLEVVGGLPPG